MVQGCSVIGKLRDVFADGIFNRELAVFFEQQNGEGRELLGGEPMSKTFLDVSGKS